jgi:deazaflavin-dependent oxidoreductase (nitroreductase family)
MSAVARHLSPAREKALAIGPAGSVAWAKPTWTAGEGANSEKRQPRGWRARPGRAAAPSVVLHALAAVHCMVYRWSRGRLGSRVRGRPVLLLTTRGRRSRRERTSPVCFLVADEQLVLAAAAGGRPRHPAWYLNLRANPQVSVQLGAQRRLMVARVAEGVEWAHLWERVCREYPICASYARRSGREIPVVVLRPAVARITEYGIAA